MENSIERIYLHRGDNRKPNICALRVPEGETRENATETIFENKTAEIFTKLMKVTKAQVEETQQIPSRINKNKFTPSMAHGGKTIKNQRQRENLKNRRRGIFFFQRSLTNDLSAGVKAQR